MLPMNGRNQDHKVPPAVYVVLHALNNDRLNTPVYSYCLPSLILTFLAISSRFQPAATAPSDLRTRSPARPARTTTTPGRPRLLIVPIAHLASIARELAILNPPESAPRATTAPEVQTTPINTPWIPDTTPTTGLMPSIPACLGRTTMRRVKVKRGAFAWLSIRQLLSIMKVERHLKMRLVLWEATLQCVTRGHDTSARVLCY